MSWTEIRPELLTGLWETLAMVGWAALIAVVLGTPLGVLLVLTDRGRPLQNTVVNRVIGLVVNIGRSLPFIILMLALTAFTRALVGTSIGLKGAIVPLAISAIPFFARLVETAVREVDTGLAEAVQSMGGSTWTVVVKALLPQALPSLVAGLTTTVIALVGYSAMAGAVGGGGLGDVAIRYGYQRYEGDVMLVTVVLLVVLVNGVQLIGDFFVRSLSDRSTRSAAYLRVSRPARAGVTAVAGVALVGTLTVGTVNLTSEGGDGGSGTVTVAATPAPHGEILDFVKDNLAEDAGIDLRVREFTDYVKPNEAVANGEVDANFFQHTPFLDDYNDKNGTDIVPTVGVLVEPLGLYSDGADDVSALGGGDTVAVPNDTTNEGRALHLLDAEGLIELKDGTGLNATLGDVADDRGLEIRELEAAQTPRALQDVDAAVVNGNYAIDSGLDPRSDAIALEKAEGNPYVNILAVPADDADDPEIRKLGELLHSPETKAFMEKEFPSSVPVFGPVG
ncbi:MetQ/NlpA family ABC transporter substrate-binding protein [Streptomyces sp. WMMC500]|nr:MetQ/NlpA family ABC transporter substrate-binding protein [Streptomyces sp. WMMC500]WBB60407.1 MetQ/NlpA family ABC transporter substrate-binding protein [Streptomyces sp. WMMC500]